MIPHKLTLRNFLSYTQPSEPLDFSHMNLAVLIGANGHGKSALLDAMTWALWGKARVSRNDQLLHSGADEMQVIFEFLLEGRRYTVARKYVRSANKTALELSVWNEEEQRWLPLTEAGIRETQKRIEALLSMDYETFVHTAFLKQGEADAFTTAQPAKRKEILAKVLNLAQFDLYAQRARDHKKATDQQIEVIEAQLQQLKAELAEEATLKEEAERLAQEEEQARSHWREMAQKESQARVALNEMESAQAARDRLQTRLDQARKEHEHTRAALTQARQRVEQLRALIAKKDLLAQRYEAWQQAQKEEQRWNDILTRRRPLEEEAQSLERRLQDARSKLETELALIQSQLTEAETAAQKLPELEKTLKTLQEELARAEAEEAAHRARTQRLATLEAELKNARTELNQVKTRQNALPELLATRTKIKDDIARLLALKKEQEARSQRIAAIQAEIAQQKREQQRLKEEAEALKERRQLLEAGETDVCPVCQRPLGDEGREHVLAEYDRQLQDLRQAYQKLNQTLQTLAQERDQLKAQQQEVDRELRSLEALQRQLAGLEHRLAEDGDERTLAEEAAALEERIRELTAEQERLNAEAQEAAPLLQTLPELRRRFARMEQQLEQARALAAQRDALRQQAEELQQRLDAGPEPELQGRLAELREQLEALAYDAQAHQAARQQLQALADAPLQWQRVRDAETRLPEEEETLAGLEERAAREQERLQEDEAELARLEQTLQTLPQVKARWQQAQEEAEQAHKTWERTHAALISVRQKLDALDHVRERTSALKKELTELKAQRHRYQTLEVAFGKKGIQAMLIDNARPELETEANRLLQRLTNGRMNVRLATKREKKSGGSQEVLDIIISDEMGSRPYELYSGGEAFRVNLALRIALSRMLARRAGAALQTLFIDEGFGTQDAEGRENLVDALNMIKDEFALILVITHIDELKDHFPVRILVEKREDVGSVYQIA
jgi:exonuclease SbcC